MSLSNQKVVIIGGCGHVGLPLGIKFALAGATTCLIDIDQDKIARVNGGEVPFVEDGGNEQLQQALKLGLKATSDEEECRDADSVVFVTGTPVDEHLNPQVSDVLHVFDHYRPYFNSNMLIVMRSTLFPGTMEHLQERIRSYGIDVKLAFCPERVAQGKALHEIDELPQIVSAFDEESFKRAYELFANLAPSIIRISPLEAELTKLMANSWRYLEFAIANQFFMIAEKKGVDFYRLYEAIRYDYPRAQGYKSPGFAAGPCLFKDTMQLASFVDHEFFLGHSAMLVNENLAALVVDKGAALAGGSLWGKTIGLLGMTFKADNDDTRESLSYRVKKGYEFKGARVLFNDPYLEGSVPLEELEQECDVLALCTPHSEYRSYDFKLPVVDVWGVFERPSIEVLPGKKE